MAEIGYLASGLLMGALLVAVVAALGRVRERPAVPAPASGDGRETVGPLDGVTAAAGDVAASPTAWVVLFLVLVVGFGGATFAAVAGATVPGGLGVALIAAFAGIIGIYGLASVYGSLRGFGRPRAEAVAVSAFAVGLLGVLAITARLLLG
jgi:hypothetical protein